MECLLRERKIGPRGESNSGPLAPEARIIPLDHKATCESFLIIIDKGATPGNWLECTMNTKRKKNFTCALCNKTFIDNAHLKDHEVIALKWAKT